MTSVRTAYKVYSSEATIACKLHVVQNSWKKHDLWLGFCYLHVNTVKRSVLSVKVRLLLELLQANVETSGLNSSGFSARTVALSFVILNTRVFRFSASIVFMNTECIRGNRTVVSGVWREHMTTRWSHLQSLSLSQRSLTVIYWISFRNGRTRVPSSDS